jgi:perosamine synthetase
MTLLSDTSIASLPAMPMSSPHITEREIAAVTDVLRSGCLSLGPKLDEFEQAMAAYMGAKHAIGVSSGTAGLHLAIIAANIGASDFVITTPFSFVASSNCFVYEHAEPIFVDVEPETGNIDPALVEAAVRDLRAGTPSARFWLPRSSSAQRAGALKAILPVHVFGQPADMDRLYTIAREHELDIIEDACEAIGAEYKGRRVGVMGDAAVVAFYPNKQITTAEGGMILTDRDDWARKFRSLRNQGRDLMDAWLRHDRLGYNYRMTELSAALGVVQLDRVDELLADRARVARWYTERLSQVDGVQPPRLSASTTRMSWFTYVVRLAADVDRHGVMAGLAEHGIPSRPYFTPIHLQPFYAKRFGFRRGDFPVAEALGDSSMALPFSGTMTEEDVDRVCRELIRQVEGAGRVRTHPAAAVRR